MSVIYLFIWATAKPGKCPYYIGTSGKHSAYAFLGCFVSQCPTNCAFILIDVNGALQIAHAVPIFDSVRSFKPSFPPPPFPSASFLAWFLSRDICDLSPFPPPISLRSYKCLCSKEVCVWFSFFGLLVACHSQPSPGPFQTCSPRHCCSGVEMSRVRSFDAAER
jgi:hypothetical protein